MNLDTLRSRSGVLFIAVVLHVFSGPVYSMDDTPDTIQLNQFSRFYQAVAFDHAMHQELYTCSRCHHYSTGEQVDSACAQCHTKVDQKDTRGCHDCHSGEEQTAAPEAFRYHIDTPGPIAAFHLQCLGCHQEDGGPGECMDCHHFTLEGEELFRVRKSEEE